jgi:hypothetical protein
LVCDDTNQGGGFVFGHWTGLERRQRFERCLRYLTIPSSLGDRNPNAEQINFNVQCIKIADRVGKGGEWWFTAMLCSPSTFHTR